MNSPVAEGLSGLLEWSEPVIFDRLLDAYKRRLPEPHIYISFARLHARVWRALISGNKTEFERLRSVLVEALASQGLDLDCLADADERTLTELVEIVVARFHRSQRLATNYHLALIKLAGCLTPSYAA
jgi:hypothetical protein